MYRATQNIFHNFSENGFVLFLCYYFSARDTGCCIMKDELDQPPLLTEARTEEPVVAAPAKRRRLGLTRPASSSSTSSSSTLKTSSTKASIKTTFKSPLTKPAPLSQPIDASEQQSYYYNVVFAIAQKKKKNYVEGRLLNIFTLFSLTSSAGTLFISPKKKCKLQNMKGKIVMEEYPKKLKLNNIIILF